MKYFARVDILPVIVFGRFKTMSPHLAPIHTFTTLHIDKPPVPEIIPKTDGKPPKGRAPSPEAEPSADITANNDDSPSWRRSASFRVRQTEAVSEYSLTLAAHMILLSPY